MVSNFQVTSSFLNNLKLLFPESVQASRPGGGGVNPWYIVAAVAFSASNKPEGVPLVFEHALSDLRARPDRLKLGVGASTASGGNLNPEGDEKLLAQKLREALFKSGLISGYPKAINGLKALYEVMPDELQDKTIQRDPNASLASYGETGEKLWNSVYGEKAESVQVMLNSVYPDMGWFSRVIGYGLVYGRTETLSALETSYSLVAALIAGDTPQQIAWHLDGARRSGASLEEVRAVRKLSIEVAKFAGVKWFHDVPEVSGD